MSGEADGWPVGEIADAVELIRRPYPDPPLFYSTKSDNPTRTHVRSACFRISWGTLQYGAHGRCPRIKE